MAIDSLTISFHNVNATYPGVGRAPALMGAFSSVADGLSIRTTGADLTNDAAPGTSI